VFGVSVIDIFESQRLSLTLQMEMKTCQEMILGTAAPLVSTFRLSYYSLLNLMSRAEGQFNSEHVIRHSFHQFQHDKVIINLMHLYMLLLLLCLSLCSSVPFVKPVVEETLGHAVCIV
jgi:hypothetical protein